MSWKAWVGTGCIAIAAIAGLNVLRVNADAREATQYRDSYTAVGYYHFGVVPDSIVFDLRDVGWDATPAGVIGGFFQFAEEMKEREFREVRLAYQGRTKFILEGHHFKQIGRENSYQNPVYSLRTFPEKLTRPDGGKAFSTWTGGMLGVLGAQMDDANQLARDWFLDEMLEG